MSGAPKQYAIIKTRFSKGDVMFEETIRVFEDNDEAQKFLDKYLENRDHGFRWSDWDEYDIREVPSGD